VEEGGKMKARSTQMSATNDLIAKKLVNALIPNAQTRALIPRQRLIYRFKKHYGGLWVGGTLYLKACSIEFRPNALNKAVHTGDMRREVMLQDIADLKTRFGILTGIIDITFTNASTFTFRCFGAKLFAERIRQQLPYR
jgi:hypothetical protein